MRWSERRINSTLNTSQRLTLLRIDGPGGCGFAEDHSYWILGDGVVVGTHLSVVVVELGKGYGYVKGDHLFS